MTKPNRFERNYRDTLPLKNVETHTTQNKTKLGRSTGKIGLNCDNCDLPFETYACWAKRHAHSFCSRACANEFKEIKIVKSCVICENKFTVPPMRWEQLTTCGSKECDIERRRIFALSAISFGDRSNMPRGITHPFSKLTEEQVILIRKDMRKQNLIAKDFNISQTLVSYIKTGKGWKHLG